MLIPEGRFRVDATAHAVGGEGVADRGGEGVADRGDEERCVDDRNKEQLMPQNTLRASSRSRHTTRVLRTDAP